MAVTTEDSNTATVDLSGVLAECIVQPSTQSPNYTGANQHCQIKLKGPYAVLKDVNNIVSMSLSAALNSISGGVSQNFTPPAPPEGTGWWVAGTDLEQLRAGDHAIMTLTCDSRPVNWNPGDHSEDDPYQDVWNLRWESYTVKPAAFCSNEPHQDRALTSMTGPEPLTGYADRQHVAYFINAGKDGCGYSNGIDHYWYRTQDGDFVLNDAEQYVLKKTLTDTNALYHYPVLTHQTVTNFYASNISSVLSNNVRYSQVLGDKIDHVIEGDVPSGCPYTFPTSQDGDTWTWVKVGDDMQHVKTKSKIVFQRTETFMGVISADANYYGNSAFNHADLENCRWKIGGL